MVDGIAESGPAKTWPAGLLWYKFRSRMKKTNTMYICNIGGFFSMLFYHFVNISKIDFTKWNLANWVHVNTVSKVAIFTKRIQICEISEI